MQFVRLPISSVHASTKDVPWEWGTAQNLAFDKAKKALSSDALLTHYNQEKELIFICDASLVGIGVVLSHIDENGDQPIAFASRTLTFREKIFSNR